VSTAQGDNQGDQIGRNFVCLTIVYLGQFLITEVVQFIVLLFSTEKISNYFDQKMSFKISWAIFLLHHLPIS
jgi:hypothetical protein